MKFSSKQLSKYEHKLTSVAYNALSQLLQAGFRIEYDLNTGEGTAQKGSLGLEFSTGQENVYFNYSAYTKGCISDILSLFEQLNKHME